MYVDLISPSVTLDQATGDIVKSLNTYPHHPHVQVEEPCGEEEGVKVFIGSKTTVFWEHFGADYKTNLFTKNQNVIEVLNNSGVKFTTPVDITTIETNNDVRTVLTELAAKHKYRWWGWK